MMATARSVLLVGGECGAGSPARRRGNFLLRGQKKVTKEEALNRTPSPRRHEPRAKTANSVVHRRDPLRSRCCPCHQHHSSHSGPPNAGCTPCSREEHPNAASLGRRDHGAASTGASPQRRGIPGEPGVQPALSGVKWRGTVLVIRTAARAKRVASSRNESGCFRAPLVAGDRSYAVQGLFFGDFLLAPQKKVTRPPGRTPGTALATNQKYRAS